MGGEQRLSQRSKENVREFQRNAEEYVKATKVVVFRRNAVSVVQALSKTRPNGSNVVHSSRGL